MRSWLPDANPLALLLAGVVAIPASVAVRDVRTGLVALAAYALAGALLLPSARRALGRVLVVAVGSVSIVYSTWLLGGRDVGTAVAAGLRVFLLAAPGAVLAAYVDPVRLGDQLGQRLHLPARPVTAFTAALQRFEHLGAVWAQLDRARRSRGLGPGRGPLARGRHAVSLAFGLLVSAMRGASTQSIAMDARGFAVAHHRTWAEPAPWTRRDTSVALLGLALAAVPVATWLAS
ncbi:energy-coupling factor transporter transmembrane component T family protein [Solicola sp. PLA-1-18]|uniref:energy-coupling factor transporter transmembrane component T family protein n=1 Tax=Solicola sp. PLA-1-18 TaxID=3380532 RepID=UPI003B7776A5